MKCPDCEGHGKTVATHVSYANGTHGYGVAMPCLRCSGSGTVPDVMREWMARGRRLREKRLAARRNLREEAARRGLNVVELSQMEHGKIEPVEE